jgi:chromate transporter
MQPPREEASLAAGSAPDRGSLRAWLLYFARLGTVGFGGPIALAARMQKELVEERRWLASADYQEGLALAQLSPGPLAAQLAMYLGWVRAGRLGATAVAAAFILPSFLMVAGLGWLYLRLSGLAWLQSLFYGVGAAIIAVIARGAWKLGRSTAGKDPLLLGILAASALATAITEREMVWVFIGAGLLSLGVHLGRARGTTLATLAFLPLLGPLAQGLHGQREDQLGTLAWYFAEAGAFVFGSGLAIVPFLHGGVVGEYHWLTERQFLDAVAVAMITPGPVVITVAFIGYLVAGPAGAVLAGLGVFLPAYLFVVIPAPYYRRIAHNAQIQAFVAGVTAAATGAIAGAAFVLGRRAIVDAPTLAIAAASLLALVKSKKIPEPLVILAAGGVGVLLKGLRA